MKKLNNFIYVNSNICCKIIKNKNLIIGTTGLCGCVGLGIIIHNELILVSHILSDTQYEKLHILFTKIISNINNNIKYPITWNEFNSNNGKYKMKMFSQNPDRTSSETLYNGLRISLEKLIYIYFEKEYDFKNFFIERCGCIGTGSPGFYIEKQIFFPFYKENLPIEDNYNNNDIEIIE